MSLSIPFNQILLLLLITVNNNFTSILHKTKFSKADELLKILQFHGIYMSVENLKLSPILGEIPIRNNMTGYEHLTGKVDRILCYQVEEAKILVGVNDQYLCRLSKKIEDLSTFLLPFQSLVELVGDLERQKGKFMVLFNETNEIKNQHSKLHEQIDIYEAYHKEGMEESLAKEKQEFSPAKREFITQMGNKLAIALADKTSRLFYLRVSREFERERAKKAALINKKVKGGIDILEHLRAIQCIMNDRILEKIYENFVEFIEKVEYIKNYINYIENKGDLLKDEEEFNLSDLLHHLACIMPLIQEFSSLYMRLVDIKYELIYRQEAINLTNIIWDAKAEVDAEYAAQDFINTEITYTQKKADSYQTKILVTFTKDKLNHLQDCQENLNLNIMALYQEIESIELVGGINYRIGNKTQRFGCSHGHTANYQGLTSISHNFRIHTQVIPKYNVDVTNVAEHKETLDLRAAQQQFQRMNLEAQTEKQKLSIVLERYREIEAKIAANNNLKYKEYSEKDRAINQEIIGYKEFLVKIKDKDFDVNSELILALMGVLFKNLSIQRNSGMLTRREKLPEYEMVEIHPQSVYDTLFNVLLEQGLVVKKCCGTPKIKKIHNCSLINFTIFKEFLLRTNIYGSLKTPDGNTQEKIEQLRGEDISMSLFKCVKGAVSVIVMKNLLFFKVNYYAISQQVAEFENFAVVELERMNHHRFSKKIKGYRFKK